MPTTKGPIKPGVLRRAIEFVDDSALVPLVDEVERADKPDLALTSHFREGLGVEV